MIQFLDGCLSIILDILGFLVSAENYWFSALFYITFIFAVFVLVYQIFRR